VTWPEDWRDRVAGTVCRFCDEGRPDENRIGLRLQAGAVSDAYLARRALVRGYVVVVWRGRHVIEPHHLTESEAAQYNGEVLRVGGAIERHFQPLKVNYMTLGNGNPHLHTHVTARYRDDPAPGGPLPGGPLHEMPADRLAEDAAALARILGGERLFGCSGGDRVEVADGVAVVLPFLFEDGVQAREHGLLVLGVVRVRAG
jgi:diadenosine tetraphosphate (Ap4A) HIT family hydrolase